MSYDPELYAATHAGSPGDVAYYQRVCRGASSVLELGVGWGRILSKIEAPIRVGLDIDEGLLSLRDDPDYERVVGDMRQFDLGRTFDRVLIPHSGLWNLQSDDEVRSCFSCASQHLAPNGRLVFDAWAADEMHRVARPEDQDPYELIPLGVVVVERGAFEVAERSTWDPDHQHLVVTYIYDGEAGHHEGVIPQRYLLSDQIGPLLESAGLQIEKAWGDFTGTPFDPQENYLVVEAIRQSS